MTDIQTHISTLHTDASNNLTSALNIRWKTASETKNQTFNDLDEAIRFVSKVDIDVNVSAIWVNLHQLPIEYTGNAEAAAICARRYLLIDIDPARPKDTNATSSEKASAFSVVREISEYLRAIGFPAPVFWVDSGNGYHLYFKLEDGYPLTSYGDAVIKKFLKQLSIFFPQAGVDKSVHDRARVVKVAGTMARKGPHSDKRPWRRSEILHRGKGQSVSLKQLEDAVIQLGGSVPLPINSSPALGEAARNLLEIPPETITNKLLLGEMLKHVSPDVSRDEWLPIIWSIAALNWNSGHKTARRWSAQCLERFDETDFDKVWNGYDRSKGITQRTLVFRARQGGYAGLDFLIGQLAKMYA
jgi:hypothetical protein